MTYEEADAWFKANCTGRVGLDTHLKGSYDPNNDMGDDDFEWFWDATEFRGKVIFTARDKTFIGVVQRIKDLVESYPKDKLGETNVVGSL